MDGFFHGQLGPASPRGPVDISSCPAAVSFSNCRWAERERLEATHELNLIAAVSSPSPSGRGLGRGCFLQTFRSGRHPHPACGRPLPEGEAIWLALNDHRIQDVEQQWHRGLFPRPVHTARARLSWRAGRWLRPRFFHRVVSCRSYHRPSRPGATRLDRRSDRRRRTVAGAGQSGPSRLQPSSPPQAT